MGTPKGFWLEDGSFVPAEVAARIFPADAPLTLGRGGPQVGTARAVLAADGLHVTARITDDRAAAALADTAGGLAPCSFAFGEHEPPPAGAWAAMLARLAPWRR
jgi:hypothetical protein